MTLLRGLTLLLLCQCAGELLQRLLHLPLPGPVLGMLALVALLQWAPLRAPVQAASDGLLQHLSLLFVPVGVGVMTHLALIVHHGLAMAAALLMSTWVGLGVTALVLRAMLPPPANGPAKGPANGPVNVATSGPTSSPTSGPASEALAAPGSAGIGAASGLAGPR